MYSSSEVNNLSVQALSDALPEPVLYREFGLVKMGYNTPINRCVFPVMNELKPLFPKNSQKVYIRTINMILTNMLRDKKLIYIRDGHREKVVKTRNNKKAISKHMIRKCVDLLTQAGYVDNTIGRWSAIPEYRRVSYFQPNNTFFARLQLDRFTKKKISEVTEEDFLDTENFIILRDSDKNDIEYNPTLKTDQDNEDLRAYNKMLQRHTVTTEHGEYINSVYYRIYNLDFGHGGRFYKSDVLQLSNKKGKYERLKLLIDGEEVVEIDYKNQHPTILMHMIGKKFDPTTDLYTQVLPLHYRNHVDTKLFRTIVKKSFNSLLNAKDELSGVRSITSNLNKLGERRIRASEIKGWLVDTYPEFIDFFCQPTSKGLELQNIDSNIANYITKVFTILNKPILTVHDSFLVKRSDQVLLARTMADAMKIVCEEYGDIGGVKVAMDSEVYEGSYRCDTLVI